MEDKQPYYKDDRVEIYCGSSRQMALPDESVQCVVCSPPYWSLRVYEGQQEEIWGGDPGCEHEWGEPMRPANYNYEDKIIAKGWDGDKQKSVSRTRSNICQTCRAWKGAYGLEPAVQMYIDHTVEFLAEIRRVLRKDGIVFWVVADSYASGKGSCFNPSGGVDSLGKVRKGAGAHPLHRDNVSDLHASGLKPKDLCLIPFRVALAAQSNGWWVRSVIIWAKPSCMPESVKDRPTSSYEYILMLTKSSRYFWDMNAVRETFLGKDERQWAASYNDVGSILQGQSNAGIKRTKRYPDANGRNVRDLWMIPTVPFPKDLSGNEQSHFAVFPEKLPEICIKAATSEKGCCPKCGAPWTRQVERKETPHTGRTESSYGKGSNAHRLALLRQAAREEGQEYEQAARTVGWQPSCSCGLEPILCVVLDPFVGSGTTLAVAKRLGRKAIGIDVSEKYCDMTIKRCEKEKVPLPI